jgi:hypothetical protein
VTLTLQLRLWAKVAGAFVLAFVAAKYIPAGDASTGAPPVRTLLLTASLIALVMTAALLAVLRYDLKLPVAACLFAIAWNVLVIAVKFVLAPKGFYDVNQSVELQEGSLGNAAGAWTVAGIVFALYLIAYFVIYRVFRAQIEHLGELGQAGEVKLRYLLLAIFGGVLLLSGGGAAILFIIPLLFAFSTLEYLGFVFQSSLSLLIATALAGAVSLAILAFKSTAERAQVLGDASVFVNFFWVGLAFLAMYHALWVVYVLVLTSIWPLKVVSAK